MAGHTFKGKRKLCYTEVADFTDYQGIGHDPLYKRYDSVFSVVKRVVPLEYQHFLATPQYLEEEDQICWHINEWEESPVKLTELTGDLREKYNRIKDETIRAYQLAAQNVNGEDLMILAGAIKYKDDERIYCCDGKVYLVAWGMTPDTRQHKVNGAIIHEFEFVKKFKITFENGEHGQFVSKLDRTMTRAEGFVLSQRDLPELSIDEGWKFEGWEPTPLGVEVKSDLHFKALYSEIKTPNSEVPPVIPTQPKHQEPKFYTCHFDAGKHGKLEGSENVRKEENTILGSTEVPQINANAGYEFKGWNVSPIDMLVDTDKNFVASIIEFLGTDVCGYG